MCPNLNQNGITYNHLISFLRIYREKNELKYKIYIRLRHWVSMKPNSQNSQNKWHTIHNVCINVNYKFRARLVPFYSCNNAFTTYANYMVFKYRITLICTVYNILTLSLFVFCCCCCCYRCIFINYYILAIQTNKIDTSMFIELYNV